MTQHAIDRAFERYGLALTGADLHGVITQVRNKTGVLVRKGPEANCEVWMVRCHGVVVIAALYRRADDFLSVRTFLPPNAVLAGQHERARAAGRLKAEREPAKRRRPKQRRHYQQA